MDESLGDSFSLIILCFIQPCYKIENALDCLRATQLLATRVNIT